MKLRRSIAATAWIVLAHGAWAAEVSYDFVACTHSRHLPLEVNEEIVAFGFEVWGVVASSTTKDWENASSHCVGSLQVMKGRPVGKGLCKWMDSTGNTAVGEFEYPQAGEPVWKWLSGTGKLKGISGTGTFRELFSAKPLEPGSSQGCRRDWGKYTLP